jgi:hypothetical protein
MPELHITPENYRKYTGADSRYFNFNGTVRWLNALDRKRRYGSLVYAKPLTVVIPTIPRDEWQKLIAEKDTNQSWLRNINDLMGVRCKDQNGLGYCHAYGTVSAGETATAVAGEPYEERAPESIGGVVTNWRNDGAYPEDDLEVLCKRGACRQIYLDKANSIKHNKWHSGWEEDALSWTAIEVFDLNPSNIFNELMTCILLNIPTSVWYNWWGHHVQGPLQAKYEDGKYWLLNRNSWGRDYGDNGYFWMSEGRGKGLATPDGAFGIRVMKSNMFKRDPLLEREKYVYCTSDRCVCDSVPVFS